MRKTLVYLLCLAVASAGVFLAAYLLGRHPSLEAELERLTSRRPAPAGKAGGIPSLRPQAPQEEPAEPSAEPEGQELGDGLYLVRSPLAEPGLVIVADLEALAESPPPGEGARRLREGLEAFLARPPAGVRLGLRSLGSAAGECGGTVTLRDCGRWEGGELLAALDKSGGAAPGPRNPARAVQGAADELGSVGGERAVAVIAGGPEACGADLCGEGAPVSPGAPRIHVILLAPPQPAEPPWAAPYRCLAERSGGTVGTASGAEELEARLRGIARSLEAALVVRATRFRGQEVQGISPETGEGWGASLEARGGERGDEGAVRVSAGLPAAFAVPAGTWGVRCWYGSLEKSVPVVVAAGERAELRVAFATGELFVQAQGPAGREIVGDSAGFGCAWGAEALPEGEEVPAAATCSFPARFELPPGTYRVRARWKGMERFLAEVEVEGGESTVRSVSFGAEGE